MRFARQTNIMFFSGGGGRAGVEEFYTIAKFYLEQRRAGWMDQVRKILT